MSPAVQFDFMSSLKERFVIQESFPGSDERLPRGRCPRLSKAELPHNFLLTILFYTAIKKRYEEEISLRSCRERTWLIHGPIQSQIWKLSSNKEDDLSRRKS